MFTLILACILFSPLYLFLILQLKYPEETIFWGERWMYNEDPKLSDEGIKYTKIKAIIGIVILTMIFLIWFLKEL
ncbi:hypothetical protein HNO89_002061 [Sporosarcina luteola]|nr:hypothetical protein [Sporosarcina luteola]